MKESKSKKKESTDTAPVPLFEQMQDQMEQMFDRLVIKPLARVSAPHLGPMTAVLPMIDMVEKDQSIEISAEMPGVAEEDIEVSLNGGLLMIKGEKTNDRIEDETGYYLRERSYGGFQRQIPLGFTPDADGVEAKFDNGVLKVHITKPAEAVSSVRKIAINQVEGGASKA